MSNLLKIFGSSTSLDLQNQVNLFFREHDVEVVSLAYHVHKGNPSEGPLLDNYGLALIYRER